ncbi:MAG: hypothetical protein ACRDGT_12825 [Candidatus Limnocylindria bacterium]
MRRIRLDRYVVKPTELNRRSGEILERAARYPVLVSRGDDSLVVARHDLVSRLTDSQAHADLLADLMGYLMRRHAGEKADAGGQFDWLSAFDDLDLDEFVGELRATMRDVHMGKAEPETVDAVIHEWHESAIRPPEFVAALKRTADTRSR